jgi:hypothetical protein
MISLVDHADEPLNPAAWCVVIWNGSEYVVAHDEMLTAAAVFTRFMRQHPDLASMGLALFNSGNVELESDVWCPDHGRGATRLVSM